MAALPPILIALIATFTVQILVSGSSSTVPVAAPALADALDINVHAIGLYTALLFGAMLVSSLISGALVARLGAIRVTQIALVTSAAGLSIGTRLNAVPTRPCEILLAKTELENADFAPIGRTKRYGIGQRCIGIREALPVEQRPTEHEMGVGVVRRQRQRPRQGHGRPVIVEPPVEPTPKFEVGPRPVGLQGEGAMKTGRGLSEPAAIAMDQAEAIGDLCPIRAACGGKFEHRLCQSKAIHAV
jgi:hypothetical protein